MSLNTNPSIDELINETKRTWGDLVIINPEGALEINTLSLSGDPEILDLIAPDSCEALSLLALALTEDPNPRPAIWANACTSILELLANGTVVDEYTFQIVKAVIRPTVLDDYRYALGVRDKLKGFKRMVHEIAGYSAVPSDTSCDFN
ncbi:hypothetical protein A3758_32220 [Oleiphilus sp. HI0118]|nr:hypothetical protein A3758_04250 [Oleiphilus sp. HI0118]KZZ48802.1 hypothetical protein A3758_32220 [Oleiphilus sp. HI0118]KZZ80885.1 hypothetical protein A3767_09135 [Oleiphilus sp. HI0133]